MAGFCTGESNFFITVQKSKTKNGLTTSLRFSISQHSIDLLLLESFVDFFNCGDVVKYKNRLICEFIVTKIDHIIEHIIPFFEKHLILGSKNFNYLDFYSAAEIFFILIFLRCNPNFGLNKKEVSRQRWREGKLTRSRAHALTRSRAHAEE
jgi:LAGLIDADG endonuclease